MSVSAAAAGAAGRAWPWPVIADRYDCRPELAAAEAAALAQLGLDLLRRCGHGGEAAHWAQAGRLLRPVDDVRAVLWCPGTDQHRRAVLDAAGLVLLRCAELGRSFWAWTEDDWLDLIGPHSRSVRRPWPAAAAAAVRPYLAAYACLLGDFTAFHRLGPFKRLSVAWRVFGKTPVDDSIGQVKDILAGWGYRIDGGDRRLATVLGQAFLLNRSPLLEDLTTGAFDRLRRHPAMLASHRRPLSGIQQAVASLGHCQPPATAAHVSAPALEGTSAQWAGWAERWYATSTLAPRTRLSVRSSIAMTGRWLAAEHPEVTEPGQWTRQLCAAWVAAVDRMSAGDYVQRRVGPPGRAGQPISARSKAGRLAAARVFFRDLQDWEWIPRRFDPARTLATPASVLTLIGPDPRVIADDVWAKLLHAGLNIGPADLPARWSGGSYPEQFVRAITLAWLFSGLRSDEITRLRTGCVRWQHHDGTPLAGDSRQVLARDAVCLLDVPVNKTGTAFTKPVDPLLGQAIEAWQAARPAQPAMTDRKTGQQAAFLFAFRARRVSKTYINNTIIPVLCRKAGVPPADVRGNITSHRARSTIASQLYNAKEPMTLFELQAWLGHSSPETTRHYAKITPNTLTRAYRDAGYFARNMRTIEVLLDRDAVAAGAATAGQPWQHYDLGHGYCSYTFFEQCPHRMACARCDFYTPKGSSQAQLLEARANLQRMLACIPLTEDERAAVEDGQAALQALLARLADIPAPAGPAPRQAGVSPSATLLPIVNVRQGKTDN